MTVRLNDNAREALQFLLLGAAIILGGRGLYTLLDRAWAVDAQSSAWDRATEIFRNGYLVPAGTLVSGGTEMAGRMGLAILGSLGFASTLAILAGVCARALGRTSTKAAVTAGRFGLITAGIWSLFAITVRPPQTIHAVPGGLEVRQRPAFMQVVALPWPTRSTFIPWEQVGAVTHQVEQARWQGCRIRHSVVGTAASVPLVFVQRAPSGRTCAVANAEAAADCRQLIAAISDLTGRLGSPLHPGH